MRKMVYLPYVRFEQEEGEAEGIGWYFTQYNAETGEGKGWHGTEFMPDCLYQLRMLDTAQVEYRKLSEVHLQYRVDDNQPE